MPTGRVMAARLAAVILIVLQSTVPAETGPEIIKDLEQRIQNGDLAAMHEIAALPPEEALPLLVNYARKLHLHSDDDAVLAKAALAELPYIPGHAEYCASFISEKPSTFTGDCMAGSGPFQYFDVLGHIRTRESVEVLCSYLRNEHTRSLPEMILGTPEFEVAYLNDPTFPLRATLAYNAGLAAYALNELHLADAPAPASDTAFSDLMPIWARWWKDRRERGIPFEVLLNGPVPPPGTAYAPDPRFSRPGTGKPLPGSEFLHSRAAGRIPEKEEETGSTTAVWLMLLMVLLSGMWLTSPRIRSLLTDEETE